MNCFYIISDTKKDYRLESAEEIKRYLEKNKKCAKIVGNASQVPADDKDSFVIVLGGDGSVLQAAKYPDSRSEFWNPWFPYRSGKAENSRGS